MNGRIKQLRKALNLTQQEFSDKLGIKRSTVATFEMGKSAPSDAAISLICKTYNVDETWLRTGEGEMFPKQTRREEITQAVEQLMSGETADFKCRLVQALSSLDEKHWEAIEAKMREIVGVRIATPAPDYEAEARAEAEEFYRQRLIEKKRAASASASPAPASAAG